LLFVCSRVSTVYEAVQEIKKAAKSAKYNSILQYSRHRIKRRLKTGANKENFGKTSKSAVPSPDSGENDAKEDIPMRTILTRAM
jgi:hypothetical protein